MPTNRKESKCQEHTAFIQKGLLRLAAMMFVSSLRMDLFVFFLLSRTKMAILGTMLVQFAGPGNPGVAK